MFLNKVPPHWRKGQTIFNFLNWLKEKKGYHGNQNLQMADPFSIPDGDLDKLYEEYMSEITHKKGP